MKWEQMVCNDCGAAISVQFNDEMPDKVREDVEKHKDFHKRLAIPRREL